MHLINWIKNLHNYIKNNIYDDAQNDYYQIKTNWKGTDNRDDYQMGYDQAIIDFKRTHRFHHYPANIIEFTNRVSKGKVSEISEFINGYHDGKIHILDKLTR
ncbi:hypothetical protein FC72_GL001256 [Companilactobacillus tucceti DSM 20183]|uniref:Uncharacterized protein n=1 Tax=Companilactobacillus tucceti DSM 20183 TaxID=1423811 RepID=A0A0R1J683_9LACO|nr:hypothetical protein [Companilactobacillus tucceti]KRK63652.1 hypothetical protein FC72_GL001256 [Companilactobacillus tucceti DSM 20183]